MWPVSELYQLDVKGIYSLPRTQPAASPFGPEMTEVLFLELPVRHFEIPQPPCFFIVQSKDQNPSLSSIYVFYVFALRQSLVFLVR